MTPQELKLSILSQAFQGKLVAQLSEEGAGADLLPVIQAECHKRITSGQIKKFKTLPAIDDVDVDFDVPDTWRLIRLGSICQLLDGEKRAGEAYPYLEARYLRGKTEPTILTEGKYVATGTNVILVDGENSGEVFRLTESGYMGSTFKVLFVPEAMLLEYVIYFLQYHKTTLRNNKKGAAIPHLNKDIFFNLILPLPPLAEQKRIVAKIEELLPLIDRYERAWSKLKDFNKRFPVDMQKSILQMAIQGKLVEQRPEEGTGEELFQQIQAEKLALIKTGKIKKEKLLSEITEDEIPFEIPESWKWVYLNDVIDVRDGTHDTPGYLPSGYPLITGKDFYNGYFDLSKTQYISEEDYLLISQRSKVDPYDILFSMIGGNIGSMIMVTPENYFEMAIKNVALFKQYSYNDVLPRYLFYFLRAQIDQMKASAKGGAQMFVSLKMLRSYLFPLPPLDEQKRIVAKLEEILPLCERLK